MAREFRGKIPRVPVDADTSRADQKVDHLFKKIKNLESIKIDANINNAQRKLETFAKRTNEQMTSSLVNSALKDFKTVLGAMKTEFESNGETTIFKNLERTCDAIESRFANLKISIGTKQLSGLEEILNNVSELQSIDKIDFGEIVSRQQAENSENVVKNIKETKKELQSIVNKIEYINRVLDQDNDSALSEQKLKNYKQKVLGLQEVMKAFSDIDSPLIKGYLSDAAIKSAEVLSKIGDKQALAVQRQAEAQEVLTTSQEKSTKALEKRLRLKKRVDEGGPKSVEGQYVTEDGLFEIDRDADGWKVHRKNAKGMYELVGVYKTKNELQRDSALIAEQEAFTAQQLAQAREAEKNALLESTDASNEYLAAQNKLLEIQQKLKSGSEQHSFARNGVYAGREGRLTLAGRIGSAMSKFNLNDDEINQLIDSTYDQFSKVRNLIVDKQEWDSAIRSTLNEVAFGKQFSNKYSGDVLNGLRGVEEFRTIIDNVRSGVIGVSEAMEQTGALVEKIALDSGSESKEINQQNISKLQNLVASLKGKYGEESFNNIFGQTVGDFGELSASNALSLYDKLISKEQEYQAELERQRVTREKIGQQMQEFMRQNQELVGRFGDNKSFESKFAGLLNQISSGSIQADSATEQLIDFLNSGGLIKSTEQKERLHEIFEIAKQNKSRDTKKYQPNGEDALRQRINELQTLVPQLKELQNEVSQMGIEANDDNFKAAFAVTGTLAEAVKNKEEDLRLYNSQLETTIKLEEFAAQAREKYGITTRSKKFSADTMSRYNELTMGLQNGLSVEDAISQLDETVQKEQKLLDTTQSVKKKLDVKPGTIGGDILSTLGDDADEAAESMAIAHDRLDNILDVISGAAAKAKFNPFENLQESEDVLKGFQDIIDHNLGDDSYKYTGSTIQGSKGVVHLKNSLGSTIDAVFRLKDGMMELDKDASKFNDKFTNFNVEAAVKRANAEVDNLESKLKGRKLDGISSLRELANNIVDNESLEKFNNELDIMQKKVSTLSGNTVSGKGMNPLANSINEMENASIIVETYRKQLNRLGDVDGVTQAAAQLDTMTDAMNRFKDASDQAGEEQAYSDYSKAESKYKAWYKYAQESKREADLNASTVSDDSQNIKATYDSILNTINKINSIDKDLMDLGSKNELGVYNNLIMQLKAEKEQLIGQLRDTLSAAGETYGNGILKGDQAVSGSRYFNENDIDNLNAFIQGVGLGTEEVNKLNAAFMQSDKIGGDAMNKIVTSMSNVQNAAKGVFDFDDSGNIVSTKDGMAMGSSAFGQALNAYREYQQEMQKLSQQDVIGANTSGIEAAEKKFLQYAQALGTVIQKEQEYFAGREKYTDDSKFTMNSLVPVDDESSRAINEKYKREQELIKKAQKFAQESDASGAIITNFVQGADGIAKLDFSVLDKGTDTVRKFRMEMDSAGNIYKPIETTVDGFISQQKVAQKQFESISDLIKRTKDIGGDNEAINRLAAIRDKLNLELSSPGGGDSGVLSGYVKEAKLAAAEVEKLYKKHQQLQNLIDSGDADAKDLDMNGDIYKQMTESAQEFISKHEGVNAKIGKLNSTTGQLKFSFETVGGEVKEFTMSLDALGKQCVTQQTGVNQLKTKWEQFTDGVSGAAKQFISAFVGMNVFYEVLSQLKQGYQYVKEIDLAMTELKKVTNETDMAYDNFLSTASKRASVIGSTVSDFTEATANFARLGYTMDESANMAETAIVYKNVADGLDTVEESTDSIISTMKAFGIESNNTMSIIDKFNAVGNSFAITSAGIGEALQRSASALFEAGNTIDESVALVTAANSVIQNPEQVGTALKTLALRLRGAKTELEEASLDTDNMAESTATLQAKLKALTHGKVDIMLDPDTFKSTTQILREMADAWEDMTDIERASALELMGGKRQANILASVIKNFDTVESVIETSLNSQGSAMAENEKYLDSIQGKTDILANSMQTLWQNAISSDFAKSMLDVANVFVKIADGAGLLNSAVSSFLGYKALVAKDNTFFDFLKIFKFDDDGFGLNNNSAIGQIISGAATSGISGAATAFKTLGLGAKAAAIGTQMLNSALTMGVSLLAGFVINKVIEGIDNYIHRAEILKEEVNGLKDTFKDAQKTFDANLKTLTTSSDTTMYTDLEDEFTRLAQGVDKYGNNISLTTDQYERYKSICNDIVGIHPSIAAGYNSATEAIGNNASVLSELIELQKYQARQNVETLISNENFTKLAKDAANDYQDAASEYAVTMANTGNDLYGRLHEIFRKENQSLATTNFDTDADGTNQDDFMRYILNTLGKNGVDDTVERYYSEALSGYDVDKFLFDHFDEIASNVQKFGKEYQDTINTAYTEIGKTIRDAEQNLNKEQDSLIDDFLLVPQGQDAGEAYEQLNSASKKFVTDWIKNSEQFKVASNKSSEEALANRDKIIQMVKDLSSDDFTTKLDGQQITGQDLLDQIYDFDTSSVNWTDYTKKMSEYVEAMWDMIGGENNTYGFKNVGELSISLGYNFIENQHELTKDRDLIVKRLNAKVEDINEFLSGLTAAEIQAFYKINWNDAEHSGINTIDGVRDAISKKMQFSGEFNIADYATNITAVGDSISTYKSALESLESGSFTMSDFISLIEQFPDLAKGVDVSSKSFTGLSKNLRKAIRNSPDDLIDDLKDLKDKLKDAGKETEGVEELITYLENMPVDTVSSLANEYASLADQIDNAKQAQNELQAAMSNNPDEGFETRGGALDQMKTLMEEGKIGSESELWDIAEAYGFSKESAQSIAEAYGFTYDSAASISENADALATFISIRQRWYKTDESGNYTYEGTENFLNDVEKIIAASAELEDVKWVYDETTGALNIDFANQDWDKIVDVLGKSKELAGLTSDEFYDLLMRVGQFHNINWQDSDDLLWYLDKLNKGAESAKEKFENTENAVKSFITSEGYSVDILELSVDSEEFKNLPEEIQNVLNRYNEIKSEFEQDPLEINFQLNKDAMKNLKDGLTKESIRALSKLTGVIHDADTGVSWVSFTDLSTKAEEAGMDIDVLGEKIRELSEAGKLIDLRTTADDPLGLKAMQADAQSTTNYLKALGVQASELDGAFTIGVPSFIDLMVAAKWTPEDISAYISSLSAQGYTFTYTTEENEVKTLDVNTEEGQAKVNELVAKSNELTDTETLKVNLGGTAESAIRTMMSRINTLTGKTHQVTVNVTRTGDDLLEGTVHASGTAHAKGTAFKSGSWGAPKTETALVGELGPELLVRGSRWTTIGDNGAEFTQIKKGDIIFNHKQTEDLLSKGYITGRGKLHGGAFASGTALVSGGSYFGRYEFDGNGGWTEYDVNDNVTDSMNGTTSALKKAADALSDSSDKFSEVFDWIEVRMEEIEETIGLLGSQLENAISYVDKNAIIDDLIGANEIKLDNLKAGYEKYAAYGIELLAKIPEKYHDAVKNGAIDIEAFVGEVDEETLEAIKNYREWAQKSADFKQQANEVITEIQNLAKQAFDNIVNEFENKLSLNDSKIDRLDAENSLLETDKGFESENIYQAMIDENKSKLDILAQQRDALQAELDSGKIEKYSDAWYEATNTIAEIDTEIVNLQVDIENLQDSINELHWEKFEVLMKKFGAINDEAEDLLDILGQSNAVDEFGNWTDEGITSLGLLAQQMEVAEMTAKQYEEEIAYLNENWQELGYTEEEYLDKLDELKSGQYDAIKAYHESKDAIVDLNKERVDAIKDGIRKEIDAYEELIDKKKEALDADKDAHDWQKSVAEQQKKISDIERQIAALSSDDSISARAKRAQLDAELLEAKTELDEMYYDRTVEKQEEAFDKEVENFKETKEAEIESWDKYLENVELIVSDTVEMVQESTQTVLETLTTISQEFGLAIAEAIINPWRAGETAVQNYGEKLNMSLTELAALFGMTVDEFAAKLGLTTEGLVSSLDITVAEMATSLGLTQEQLAAKFGLTTSDLSGKMDMTIQQFATSIGYTIPELASKLGTTTSGLVGNLDMTMAQFAGKLGLTVDQLSGKFGLTARDLASKLGQTYQQLTNPFGMSMSATVDGLKELEKEYQKILNDIESQSLATISRVNHAVEQHTNKTNNNASTLSQQKTVSLGSKINAGSAKIYSDSYGGGEGTQYYGNDPIYTVVGENNGYWLVRYHKLSSGYTGWFKKSDVKAYAKGTTGVPNDQWALIDELGDELQLIPDGRGRLSYMKKGTGVVPADLTANLMEWGKLDPSVMLDQNRPKIGANPSVVNNTTEVHIDASVGELLHVEHLDGNNPAEITKIIDKAWDKRMKELNSFVRKYSR